MKSLTGQDIKAILHKLLVFTEGRTLQYFVSAVIGVIEQWMPYVFHVCPDLVCATGLQLAAD
jgi:hypothetical protein